MSQLLIVLATVLAMEAVAWAVHKYIMHGDLGWGWHESHHTHTEGPWERNDLYAVVFSILSAGLFIAGSLAFPVLWWIGVGMLVYGLLYAFVHDGLVHQRWPFEWMPKSGYLRRLVLAHRMHHHVTTKDDSVAFGFLYAENPDRLKATLKARRQTAREMAARREKAARQA